MKGRRVVRRIFQWLSRAPHGSLVHLTCTQRVIEGESLVDARARLLKGWLGFKRRLADLAVVSALVSHHLVWSEACNGWHYHVHLLAEVDGVVSLSALESAWADAGGADGVHDRRSRGRLVTGGGAAIVELAGDSGDVDLWSEAAAPVSKAIQYPIRDALQGLSSWRLGGPKQMCAAVREFVESAKGWRLHETIGKWRKPAPADPAGKEGEGCEEASEKVAAPSASVLLGSPDRVLRLARSGDLSARAALLGLERACNNVSEFAKRLVWFCGLGRSCG